MCGLAGFLSPLVSRSESDSCQIAMRMVQELRHRGPDDSGSWSDQQLTFAHSRLSIIDLSHEASQPMRSADGRYVLVYNGEVYNYQQLRSQYLTDVKLRTHCDTEVVLELIAKLGPEQAVSHLNGIFAFAVWDTDNKVLYLARDRMGVKPLYWSRHAGNLLFSSEIKALLVHPSWTGEMNMRALGDFFKQYYIRAPETIYQNCYKLEPGTLLKIQSDNLQESIIPYYDITQDYDDIEPISLDHATNQLDQIIANVVENQMVSDVPIGAFLSGGVDSSLIVANMMKHTRVKTFSIGYEEKAFDESDRARSIAGILGSEHHEFKLTPDSAFDIIQSMPRIYDEPFADASQIPTCMVSQYAKQQVTVALSGDGADELFGGYPRYANSLSYWNRIESVPGIIRYLAPKLFSALPSKVNQLICKPFLKNPKESLKVMSQYLGCQSVMQYQELANYIGLTPQYFSAANLINQNDKSHYHQSHLSVIAQLLLGDQRFRLPDGMLTKVDRASMAASLEVRVPFLDNRIIRFAHSLPDEYLMNQSQQKIILKQLLHKYLPANIINAPKTGFHIPIKVWLKTKWKAWADELILANANNCDEEILSMKHVRKVWHEFQAGNSQLVYPLWGTLMYLLWRNEYKF